MNQRISHRFLTPLLILLLLAVFSPPASGQSDNALRKENQRLTTQVRDLQQELKAAQERLDRLEREIRDLKRQLAAAGQTPTGVPAPPTPTPKVTIDESSPDASPRALLAALKKSYAETLDDLELGEPGDRTRTAYLRALSRWQANAARQYRAPVSWHVRAVDRAVPVQDGHVLRVIAVDPETDVELGIPFDLLLARSAARRLMQMEQRGTLEVLALKGILVPQINVDEARTDQGAWDFPPFIGSFAEFGLTVEVQTLLPVRQEDQRAVENTDSQ